MKNNAETFCDSRLSEKLACCGNIVEDTKFDCRKIKMFPTKFRNNDLPEAFFIAGTLLFCLSILGNNVPQ